MFKLTLRNLLDKKIRFVLTTSTVVIGVMFVVGVFVLTDSIRTSFDELAGDIEAGVDLTVRSPLDIGDELDRVAVPQDIAEIAETVPGVASVDGRVVARNTVISDGEGEPILPNGPPTLGFSWFPTQFFIIDGHQPEKPDQFATDATTASDNDLVVGDVYTVSGPTDQREFTLSGIFNFGDPEENKSIAGTTMAAFELTAAQDFLDKPDSFNELSVVVQAGADPAVVQEALDAAVGDDFEVVSQQIKIEETQSDFNAFISIFGNVLLAFALIAVFVSAFIINNTFQIILGQRVRELGLLRALGATGRQVSRSVLGEAAMVGVFSTVVGIFLGLGLARVLRSLLKAGGFSLPDGPIELQARTIIFAVAVGMGVTVLSSIAPARRARGISPMAALSDSVRLTKSGLGRRIKVGATMVALGWLLLGLGLFAGLGTQQLLLSVSSGGILIFIGTTVLSPAFATQISRILGWPIQRLFGVPGRLARENAARSPRRTSSTAGALMIGLALVSMAGVVGQSIKKTFVDTLDNSVQADYFVRSTAAGFDPTTGFPAEVEPLVNEVDDVDLVVGYHFGLDSISINGSTKNVFTTDFSAGTDHMDPDVVAGSITNGDPLGSILLNEDPAEDLFVGVGDTVVVQFPDGAVVGLEVAAIYADSAIFDNYVIDNALWNEHFNRPELLFLTASISGFSDDLPEEQQVALLASSAEAIRNVTDEFPTVSVENRVEFRQSQQAQLDSFLITITVFLTLALFIALIGIANTLALSVFERTREIGLLRAVGLTRRQLRRSVRWEAAIVSVFGAILGVGLGLAFGVAAAIAIPDTAVNTVAVPWGSLAIYVVVAAVAGLIAAIIPARRAARMNVLEAIATE